MEVKDFINGNVTYDREGQYFWINTPEQGQQMLGELRGWGHIQNMFKDKKGNIDADAAGKFQDEVGEWVADAINKKMAVQPPEMVKTDCTLCFGTGDYKRAGWNVLHVKGVDIF